MAREWVQLGPKRGQNEVLGHFLAQNALVFSGFAKKLMHFEQANGRKPHFGPFLVLNGPF